MGLMETLFGEKCGRCNQRTTLLVNGLCGTCTAEMRAKEEEHRVCPVDGQAMQKQVRLNIVVDQCPTCHGVWLDGGELEVLQRGIANASIGEQYAMGVLTGPM